MKKKIAVIVIFIIVLVFPMVSWPFLASLDNIKVDENRELAEFPDFDNQFISKFDKFFTDHVPFRGAYIKLYSGFNTYLNKLYVKIAEKQEQKPNTPDTPSVPDNPNEPSNPSNPNEPEQPTPPQKDELEILYELINQPRPQRPSFVIQNDVVWGKDDWLFFYGQDSLEYFLSTNLPTEEELKEMVAKAEKINNYFKAQGKEFIIYVAPNKEQIYYEYMFGGESFSKIPKRWDVIAAYFRKYSDVKVIYPKTELLTVKEQRQIYLKYDTHWNTAGGYYGACELLKVLNISPASATFTPTTRTDGDLRAMLPASPVEDNDFVVTYRPEIEGEVISDNQHYPTFISTSNNPNGRTMFILGDSFRENMLPILCKEFSQIYANHRVMFNKIDDATCYDKEINEADVIVFQAVERVGDDNFDIIDEYCAAHGIK